MARPEGQVITWTGVFRYGSRTVFPCVIFQASKDELDDTASTKTTSTESSSTNDQLIGYCRSKSAPREHEMMPELLVSTVLAGP